MEATIWSASVVPHSSVGPRNPHTNAHSEGTSSSTLKPTLIEEYSFNSEYNSYQRSGFAVDLSTNEVLGDQAAFAVDSSTARKKEAKKSKNDAKRKQYELELEEDSNDDDLGPWAAVKESIAPASTAVSAKDAKVPRIEKEKDVAENAEPPANVYIVEPDEEDEMWARKNERKLTGILPPRPKRGSVIDAANSTFHGTSEVDYQGRSWAKPPSTLKPDQFDGDHECYLPKKCIKKFIGHTKGVQSIEFFPKTGHLLLSASMDGKCKIWDTTTDFGVRRTYAGHSEGIKSMHMSNSGSQFLTSAFDRYIRLWDTETGQAVGTFSNRTMGYCVKFNPRDNNVFLAAASDNKIYQWDTRTGQICQEYNYHLQPCNTIAWIDEGRKFMSTSDDKKLLVWEYDIPVPIKYIAEPDMHCIPTITVHPSGQFMAGQSMDNKIVVYTSGDKVKPLKKKVFQGHNNSGYACQIGFSPNGKFLASGDGHGQLHFWDWKTTKAYRKLQAHDNGPCMSAVWHPLQPSWVATCGWDGLIKLWD